MHWLVAAYLGHEPPDDDQADEAGAAADASVTTMASFGGVAPQLQASAQTRAEVANASSPLEALAAIERMHFGEVKDVREI